MNIETDFSGVMAMPSGPAKVMLSVVRTNGRTVVRINSSSLSIIQTCPRKAFYSLEHKWKAKYGSAPLIYGSAIHKAMEVFYRYPGTERSMPDNFDEHATLMGQGHPAPIDHFMYDAIAAFVQEAQPLAGLNDYDQRSLSSGIWCLGHYFNTYLNDNYVIHADEHGPMIERQFELILYENDDLTIILFGTIDLILKNIITSEILPADHKTVGRMNWDFMNRVKPNHQYTGYLIGAQRVLGIAGDNFLVNAFEVKARPKTDKAGPPKFLRQITTRTPEDFSEFTDVVVGAVKAYLGWQAENVWPLGHVDACAMYGSCQFHEICSAPNELRDNILQSKFTRE